MDLTKFKELVCRPAELTMSSLEIAELTDKRHKHVLRDIDKLLIELEIKSDEILVDYLDAKNRKQRMYKLNKELCLTLISGYSVLLRNKIIKRWLELEQESLYLSAPPAAGRRQGQVEWHEIRLAGKVVRRKYTDVIKELVLPEFQEIYHSNSCEIKYIYANFTLEIYRNLFACDFNYKFKDIRNKLEAMHISHIRDCEKIAVQSIQADIEANISPTKYLENIANKIKAYADLVGREDILKIVREPRLTSEASNRNNILAFPPAVPPTGDRPKQIT